MQKKDSNKKGNSYLLSLNWIVEILCDFGNQQENLHFSLVFPLLPAQTRSGLQLL